MNGQNLLEFVRQWGREGYKALFADLRQGKDLNPLKKCLQSLGEASRRWVLGWIETFQEGAEALRRGESWDWNRRREDLCQKLGVSEEAFPEAFWETLTARLGGEESPDEGWYEGVRFPLVLWGSEGKALLARFRLRRLKDRRGQVFLDPEQVPVRPMAPDFAHAMVSAARAVRSRLGKGDLPSVAICIDAEDSETAHWLAAMGMTGPSAGGALALSLWGAWSGEPVDTSLVVSVAVDERGCVRPVGSIGAKAWECVQRQKILVVHRANAEVIRKIADSWSARPEVLPVEDFDGLLAVGRAYPGALLDYLKELEKRANEFTWHSGKTKKDVAVPVFVTGRGDVAGRPLDWGRFLRQHRRILLTGPPGTGKSFAVDMAILGLIEEARACLRDGRVEEAPVPVLLKFEDLSEDLRKDPEEAIRKHLRGSRLPSHLWVFVEGISGDDEETREFIAGLDRLLGEGGRLVLVTGTPPDVPVLADAAVCEPAPLKGWAQVRLITHLVGPEQSWRVWDNLRRSPALRELCRRPLFLTLYCLSGKTTQTESLHAVLHQRLEDRGISDEGLRENYLLCWSRAVFRLFREDPRSEFSFDAFSRELAAVKPGSDEMKEEMRLLGNSVARTSGGRVIFIHPSLAFYLAGLGWAFEFVPDGEVIRQRLKDRRWDPVWPFVAGHLRQSGRTGAVTRLVEEIAAYLADWSDFKTREELEALLGILLQCLWEGQVLPFPERCRDAIVQVVDSLQQSSRRWEDQWKRIRSWPWWGLALAGVRGLGRPIRDWVYRVVGGALMPGPKTFLKGFVNRVGTFDPLVRWGVLWVAAAWKGLARQNPIVYTRWRERLQDPREHPAVRALAARALVHRGYPYADRVLGEVLRDSETPAPVKVAALRSLGHLALRDRERRAERLGIICQYLDDRDPVVLQGAIHALVGLCRHCTEEQKKDFLRRASGWLDHPSDVPPREGTRRSYPPVRSGAASLVGKVLEGGRAGRRACCGLEAEERRQLFEALVGALSDPTVTVRRSAAWALSQAVGCPCVRGEGAGRWEFLVQRFWEEPDPKAVEGITGALAGLGDVRAVGIFLKGLRDPLRVRACFWALMRLEGKTPSLKGRFSRELQSLPPEAVRVLCESVFSDPEGRAWAVRVARRVMEARPGAPILRPLLMAWEEALKRGRRPELGALGRDLMGFAGDPELRGWAVRVLAGMYADLPEDVKEWMRGELPSWLGDPDPVVRRAAWRVLRRLVEEGAHVGQVGDLRELLRGVLGDPPDGEPGIRKEALLLAERLGFVPPNPERFLRDGDGSVRAAAAGLLAGLVGRGGSLPPVEDVRRLLGDSDGKVRASAVRLVENLLPRVGKAEREDLITALVDLLSSDRSRDVQKSVIVALHRNVRFLGERLEEVGVEVEKRLRSSDPILQETALGFLEGLASRGFRSSLGDEEALQIFKRGRGRLWALWHFGSRTEWMNKDSSFWKVYGLIKKLVLDGTSRGRVRPAELASALFVLNTMLQEREDLARTLRDPERWVQKAFELLGHRDDRVVRGAMSLLGSLGRYHEGAVRSEVLQEVAERAWGWLTDGDPDHRGAALHVFQADVFRQRVLETHGDFLERLKDIVLQAGPGDKVLDPALYLLRRPAVWEGLNDRQRHEVLGRCLDLLDAPRRPYVQTVLGTLADARIAESLPEEGRRRVVERVLGWMEAPDVPGGVLWSVLVLLRQRPYWELIPKGEGLLERFQGLSDPAVQATLLGFLLEDHVWDSLSPQFRERMREWARSLLGSESPAVRRNAVWVCARRWGEGRKEVCGLLQSPDSKDLVAAVWAAGDLADRWGKDAERVMGKLWELMDHPVPAVATLAWFNYARLLEAIGAPAHYVGPFVAKACKLIGGEARREVLYGVFDGLTELAHRLGEWDRRQIGEALGRWLKHPHEKVRRKAAFLAALVGTPEEAAEALRELSVPPEGVPEDVAERRRFLRQILEEKGP